MKDLVVCGYFLSDENLEEAVFCNPHTGDLILQTGLMDNLLIGNVSVNNPIDMEDKDCSSLRDFCGACGVVVTEEYLLAFKEDFTVDYRRKTRVREVELTSTYDLDADYEGDLD